MNRLRACEPLHEAVRRPARHSSAAMTRGITSKGQARSMLPASEYTVNVMPMEAMASSAASWRSSSSSPSSVEVVHDALAVPAGRVGRLEHLVPVRIVP